jgi:hypothetical protein
MHRTIRAGYTIGNLWAHVFRLVGGHVVGLEMPRAAGGILPRANAPEPRPLVDGVRLHPEERGGLLGRQRRGGDRGRGRDGKRGQSLLGEVLAGEG